MAIQFQESSINYKQMTSLKKQGGFPAFLFLQEVKKRQTVWEQGLAHFKILLRIQIVLISYLTLYKN